MFIDYARIVIKSGNGGNGCISFLSYKGIAKGGPDGGDGGKGGDVIFVCDPHANNLIDFKFNRFFRAENGEHGTSKNCHGKGGKDLIIKVPRGTIIRDLESGRIVADMFYPDACVTVLKGGVGGKGNARFATSRRKAPHFAQTGEKTEEHEVVLELKTIADAGLTGFPNVGKSTLLSVLTAAKPKIANYHFTTLSPNLGVVKFHDDSFVLADIPGLIEGAAEGAGLGHSFLRHIERTRLIVHVVDVSGCEGRDPYEDYLKIKAELKEYSEELASRPEIIAANKCDLDFDGSLLQAFKEKVNAPVYGISAVTRQGLPELLQAIEDQLKDLPKPEPIAFEPFEYLPKDASQFEIMRDDDGTFVVVGGFVDRLARNVVVDDPESFAYFQKAIKLAGVIKELRKAGAQDGDTVSVGDIEFEFIE